MKNTVAFITRIGMTLSIICFVFSGISQSVDPPKIETPNVASLEKFGEVPVDLATGTPNISIPIHTLHYGNISVPISLRYHPGNLRVSQHPGWVGLGWDLQSGGAITRVVRGLPDEFYGAQIMNTGLISTYYPEPVSPTPRSGSEIINNNANWETQSILATYFEAYSEGGNTGVTDFMADEFSFNFLGYSGKFYYEGPTNGWQAVCDENVQVNVINPANPFLTGDQVQSTISSEFNAPSATGHLLANSSTIPPDYQTRQFSGFVITVPDGTKYYFGGVDANNNGIGIEFNTPYGKGATQFYANTWLLTKIIDADGNKVDFNYSASYPTVDLGFNYDADNSECQSPLGWWFKKNLNSSTTSSGLINPNCHYGNLLIPLYLDNITCPLETINFNRGVANNCLRFSEANFRNINNGLPPPNNLFVLSVLGDGTPVPLTTPPCSPTSGNNYCIINGVNNIQWEQLNSIQIAFNGLPAPQISKQYLFNYSNNSTQRLSLTSFQELDNTGFSISTATSIAKYSFSYNNIGSLPLYDADFTDHWGFYNGAEIANANPTLNDAATGSIYSFKQTNSTLATTGALTQINYPTGGYTTFKWTAHDYSQVVSSSRSYPLLNQSGFAGGLRISEVKSYLPNGAIGLDKTYFYVRGYSNSNRNGSSGSGILNGIPTYNLALLNRLGANGQLTESITATIINSLAIYSYNSEGSYINYDEVDVVNADGSYTKNYLTSYGADLNGVSHWDMQPVGSIGWLPGTDNYYPMNTLDQERGKLLGVYKYTSNDILVQKTVNTYRNDAGRFNNYLRKVNFNGAYNGCALYDGLILATTNRIFTYDYYITNQAVTNYDQRGENPLTTSISYTYNVNNLVSTKTELNSKGESIQTSYTYPNEITSSDPTYTTCQAMTSAHIISPIITTIVTKNGVQLSLTKVNYYSPITGMYKPQNIQMQIGNNTIETKEQFYNYDSHGNVEELSKTNDTHDIYLWGYNREYPVAKITGSTISAVNAIVTQSQIDGATSLIPTNDPSVRALLKLLRTSLPGALVTYYTYLPLTGITSETDPRGQTTFYQYDNFQRLKAITDFNGNILKTFNYQYQITQ